LSVLMGLITAQSMTAREVMMLRKWVKKIIRFPF
jgi:hypothetical protein